MPKLTWYIHRLRAMSAAEVGYRLRHAAQARLDRARLNSERLPGWSLPEPLEPGEAPFFFDPARAVEMRAVWARDYPEGLARLREEADELLAGHARVFDREMTWTDVPNWHVDLVRGGEWPRCFWAQVPIRDGGVKHVWELARHQHLMTLARAAFVTGEQSYATAACRWLKSWIDENPPYIGVHWTSALELALRLISWAWTYRLLKGFQPAERESAPCPVASILTPDLEREFFRLVQLQAEYIRRYHSAHSSANNHLIGEAAGVATAGLAFPWLADAHEWRDWGMSVLAEELPRQCHPDGVTAEQAFHYQAFVMDLVLQPLLLSRFGAREAPAQLSDRLEAMAEFIHTAMDASGGLPNVGDADDGAAILLGQDLHHPYRSLLATCGVLFHRPEFCRATPAFDEKSAWLLGMAGRERFEQLRAGARSQDVLPIRNRAASPSSRQFPEGGYSVMRSGVGSEEQLLMLDHGPLGYLSIAAHGHADCLSLLMHLGGRPVLVDPGTYTYHEQPEWREYFRGTPGHNTVTIDGEHQSVMTGPTMWGQRAKGTCRRWVSQAAFDFVEAEHDGYQRLSGRPVHRRSVFQHRVTDPARLLPSATFVVDRVFGDGTHEAELNWHLASGSVVEATGDGTWLANGDGFRLQLSIVTDATAETDLVEGREGDSAVAAEPDEGSIPGGAPLAPTGPSPRLPQGWVSPQFGIREKAPVLSSRQSGPLPITWITVLLPHSIDDAVHDPSTVVDGWVTAQGAVVTLIHPGWREIYAHSFASGEEAAAGRGGRRRKSGIASSGSNSTVGFEASGESRFLSDDHQPASGSTKPAPEQWLDLGEGRFRGQVVHLLLDGVGRIVQCRVVGGVELEWGGRTVWRAAGRPEDASIVLSPEAADDGGTLSGEDAGAWRAGMPVAAPPVGSHASGPPSPGAERSETR